MTQLHERFKDVRESKILTQNHAARHLGVSRKHLVDIEAGIVSPRYDFIIKFANFFRVDVHWMLTGVTRTSTHDLPQRIQEVLNDYLPKS